MPRDWLADPESGFACTSCPFLTIKWEYMAEHATSHWWNLPNTGPILSERWPAESCASVKVQTLFPYPHIQWSTVDMSGDFEMNGDSQEDKLSSILHQISPVHALESSHEMSANDQAQEDEEISRVYQNILQERQEARMGWPREKGVQRKNAQANKITNSRSAFIARLPLEIRLKIYGLALKLGTNVPHSGYQSSSQTRNRIYSGNGSA